MLAAEHPLPAASPGWESESGVGSGPRVGPQVDARLDGVPIDLGELVVAEVEPAYGGHVVPNCCTVLAPIRVEVTRGSRSTQASANWARVCPRDSAMALSARTRSRVDSS